LGEQGSFAMSDMVYEVVKTTDPMVAEVDELLQL